MAKRNPPLPWFQPRLKVSGKTANAKITGEAIIANAIMILLFCNKLNAKSGQ
jgi:hypothetical protein